ncbi:hypothetical protein T4C_8018 [Trichinella pseudospiralis]|uniref:Uncharacterized protein n=1 Tax=Trichinella pseudospiralis TaxID=6337 RepID=A0A0V1K1M5_TRIPS|nr:hypothetical protein T4C_8018 [Trichinella pseudospiralis]
MLFLECKRKVEICFEKRMMLILSIEWDKETSEFNKNRGILHLFFTIVLILLRLRHNYRYYTDTGTRTEVSRYCINQLLSTLPPSRQVGTKSHADSELWMLRFTQHVQRANYQLSGKYISCSSAKWTRT